MAEYLIQGESLTAIADEIRELSDTTESMGPDAMASNVKDANTEVYSQSDLIAQIQTALEGKAAGGGSDPVLQEKTVTPTTSAQEVVPDEGYDGMSKVTVEAVKTVSQGTPYITVDKAQGKVHANVTQSEGYVAYGQKTASQNLPTQEAQTITPGTTDQTIAKQVWLKGDQTIKGDANLVPENIVSGKTIFGVEGTAESGSAAPVLQEKTVTPAVNFQYVEADEGYDGLSVVEVEGDSNLVPENIVSGVSIFGVTGTHSGGIDTSDATATADKIFLNETAYADGEKITGMFTIDEELNTQDDLIAQIQTALEGKIAGGSAEISLQHKTVTPSESAQTVTADSGYDGLDIVTVNAIPSTYVEPNFTKTTTIYTPTTIDQTIAAGTYCSGVQTIIGDPNLISANIISGKSIFGVAGSAEVGGESSSGGSFQTASIIVTIDAPIMMDETLNYVSPNNGLQSVTLLDYELAGSFTIQCITPSIISISGNYDVSFDTSGNIIKSDTRTYYTTGDGTLYYRG